MRRILLTGATGFLGSFLLKRLIDEGHYVVVLKRSFSDTHRINEELKKTKSYNIDLVSIDTVFQENPTIDLILHTATNYGRENASLSSVLCDNVIFPIRIAEAGVLYNCRTFINTDSFFGKGDLNYEYLAYYTLSKKILLDALRAINIQLINCRLEHVYGLKDDNKKFVTTIIRQLLANKPSIDLTDGKQKRDFVFVEDVVNAFSHIISAADNLAKSVEFEIGTGNSVSIFDFVSTIKTLTEGSKTQLNWGVISKRPGEFGESKANNSNLLKLGWKPEIRLEEGILRTINYYKTNGI